MSNPIFFPNINGLRFIAAFIVILHHIEYTKLILGVKSVWTANGLGLIGTSGVTLFFTLSGFLITYLLLSELKEKGRISKRKFYMRRILRIWPVYFLVVLIGLFFFPSFSITSLPGSAEIDQNFNQKLLLFIFFLPNVAIQMFGEIPMLAQTWSIGVEEQFYIAWPWLVRNKWTSLVLFSGTFSIFFIYDIFIGPSFRLPNISMFRFGPMAMGALGAWVLFYRVKQVLYLLHNHFFFLIVCSVLVFFMISKKELLHAQDIYSVLFISIIVYLASAPKKIISLNNFVLDYLGRISYGIYMYQFISIVVVIKLVKIYCADYNSLFSQIIIYSGSIVFTILISALSYQLIEIPFLKFKEKFMTIASVSKI
ncbi:MAG: acyltransferase family protein [Bacteroidota bacterium]